MKISTDYLNDNLPSGCRYCGKQTKNINAWCSEECKRKDKQLIEERRKKGLCLSCGNENPTIGIDKDMCVECNEKIIFLMKKIKKCFNNIDKNG